MSRLDVTRIRAPSVSSGLRKSAIERFDAQGHDPDLTVGARTVGARRAEHARTLTLLPHRPKMGEHKDWPNMFAADMPPEQREYFMDTLLKPGYDRFVDTVSEAREIKRDEVVKLATGRIFMAPEARKAGLIDEVGYFERAVEIAKEHAGITEARVVEYIQPFRLFDILGVNAKTHSLLSLDREKLSNLASPRIMYLWTGY